jgi:2-methylaconitate cis-trans-isomerase PrpF
VAGTGVPVELGFEEPAGSSTGRLLPTGHEVDLLHLADGPWAGDHAATLVDAGAPAALLEAGSFGLTGGEDLLTLRSVVPELTALRRTAGVAMGLYDLTGPIGHAVPKVGLVAAPVDYRTTAGEPVPAASYDLAVRMVSMHAPHPAIGLTSAVAVVAAALTEGALPQRLLGAPVTDRLRLGTPGGVVPVGITRTPDGALRRVTLQRAARRLTESTVLVPLPAHSTSQHTSATLLGAGPEGRIA